MDEFDEQMTACGSRLHDLRTQRGWTLEELAERTGLSKPFLSRLEAGDRRPSIAAILTLARVYEISVGTLFEQPVPSEPCIVVRSDQAQTRQGDGLTYRTLSNATRFANLQPIRVTISSDRSGDERYQHEGEEWIYVLSGQVRLAVGDKFYDLDADDCAHFNSELPHRLTALGGLDAEVIVVACPIPEATDPQPRRRIRQKRAVR